ncbi:hypothetical protein B0H17DRAFT_1214999 [Mycena rosella]|uniref:Uncharacterized protein n=1 Tax=Mycena rosella TaxID=1033263 RepID=A0AAD7CLS4_MYCRO|nr:hypothetical protein B0H17DRAFT_1214999 [Mycena rosella]
MDEGDTPRPAFLIQFPQQAKLSPLFLGSSSSSFSSSSSSSSSECPPASPPPSSPSSPPLRRDPPLRAPRALTSGNPAHPANDPEYRGLVDKGRPTPHTRRAFERAVHKIEKLYKFSKPTDKNTVNTYKTRLAKVVRVQ